jgi:hypothetical protein
LERAGNRLMPGLRALTSQRLCLRLSGYPPRLREGKLQKRTGHKNKDTRGVAVKAKAFRTKLVRQFTMLSEVLFNEGLLACLEYAVRHLGTDLFGISSLHHPRINLLLISLTDAFYDLFHGVDTGHEPSILPQLQN